VYGVRESAEWAFLVGREVLHVRIGLHQVSLRFDGQVSMNIECDFDHDPAADSLRSRSGILQKAAGLVSLLGSKVTSVMSMGGKILEIRFVNKETLKLYDSNELYESFQVTTPDKKIIV
jgi:hypothetical protein